MVSGSQRTPRGIRRFVDWQRDLRLSIGYGNLGWADCCLCSISAQSCELCVAKHRTLKAWAAVAPDADEPKFEFVPVDTSLIPPKPRKYDAVK